MKELESKIGYTFKNKELIKKAVTHSSFANEVSKRDGSNERLEFLGDAVLSIIISDYLYKNYNHLPEGELTKLRASLVCEKSLFGFSKQLQMGEFLMLGKGEVLTGGRERSSILADAFEAVLAAIYLDGGIEPATTFVMKFALNELLSDKKAAFTDYKTMLQEIIQKNPDDKPIYILVGESGPDHDKKFMVEVSLNADIIGKGEGRSKKEAEQAAAAEALKLMGI